VLLVEVEPGGPAAAAGVRQGDVIVELAGEPVDSLEDLTAVLQDMEPGQQTRLTVVRANSERAELPITVGSVTG
jgi:S1-C subfamily serine protease